MEFLVYEQAKPEMLIISFSRMFFIALVAVRINSVSILFHNPTQQRSAMIFKFDFLVKIHVKLR